MKNKIFAWVYGLALLGGLANAYFNYLNGNFDAMIAWTCAGGMAGGAMGAYIELIEKENDEDNIS